jgi:hypothetical protein
MNEGSNLLEQVLRIAPEEDATAPSSSIKDKKPIFRTLFSDATETWIRDQSSSGEYLQQLEEGHRETPSLQQISYAEDSSEEESSYGSASYDNVEEEEEEEEEEDEDEEVDSIDSCIHDNDFTEEGSDIRTDDNDNDNDNDNDDDDDSIDSGYSIRSKSSRVVEVFHSPAVDSNETDSMATTSTKNMRGMFSARNSLDDTSNSFWTNSASDANSDSRKSIEFEMVVDLRTSWTTVREPTSQSQSQSSSYFSTLGDSLDVFVQDDKLCWLPARVIEHRCDHALVAISLPKTWCDSTIVEEEDVQRGNGIHSSIKKMAPSEVDMLVSEFGIPVNMLRKISYSDYEMGELPGQNVQTTGKHDVVTSVNKAPSDLADLRELHMATILFNLKERHFVQKPYTRVGDILIAMNPFIWIDRLYTPENRDIYSHHLIWNCKFFFFFSICDTQHMYELLLLIFISSHRRQSQINSSPPFYLYLAHNRCRQSKGG